MSNFNGIILIWTKLLGLSMNSIICASSTELLMSAKFSEVNELVYLLNLCLYQ
jgi:hypothetical protein